MRYYEPETMAKLRATVEAEVMAWPLVTSKLMFGCPCYQAGGRMFAFLVTDGLVLTNLTAAAREELSAAVGGKPFTPGTRTMKGWLQVPLTAKQDLQRVAAALRESYEIALIKPPGKRPTRKGG
jgi:hypothetical protein